MISGYPRLLAKMSTSAALPSPSLTQRLESSVSQLEAEVLKVRRHLHACPELSGNEYQTTAFVAEHLAAAGIGYKLGPDDRGIITEISGNSARDVPVVAFRADLDALPIGEENDVPYRSRNSG